MVTWSAWEGYDKNPTDTTQSIWVTAAPEVQQRCSQFGLEGEDLEIRIAQLLGLPLPPDTDHRPRRFVELWVDPAYLFRPTPDPEITDRAAQLGFPIYLEEFDTYRLWFSRELEQRYHGPLAAPWTRLGYTYDWGGDSEIGVSEFVIRAPAPIEIARLVAPETYCANVDEYDEQDTD